MKSTTNQFADNIISSLQLTNAEQAEMLAIETQQNVCDLLGWTEDHYAAFVYGTGIEYLKHLTSDAVLIERFERSPLFWNWFKNCWVMDDVAVVGYLHSQAPYMRYSLYCHYHDALEMKETMVMPKCVRLQVFNTYNK